jgi:PhnB protein
LPERVALFHYLIDFSSSWLEYQTEGKKFKSLKSQNMTTNFNKTFFAPELFINNGVKDISFYENAFGAIERLRFSNDDGSIHVAELSIDGAIFHIHEITSKQYFFSPDKNSGTTICIGLFVSDVDKVMSHAIKAGAIEISPPQDYEYGYRQAKIKDPFGHYWQIQKKI